MDEETKKRKRRLRMGGQRRARRLWEGERGEGGDLGREKEEEKEET